MTASADPGAEVAARRLAAQRLTGEPFASVVEAVAALGAVQAQDYAAAKWALALRTPEVTEAEVDALFDAGAFLRVHVMRPTWHFVAPADALWLQQLTSERTVAGMQGRFRRLELDRATFTKAVRLFTSALRGHRWQTREELGALLARAGISPAGQRLPHLLAWAEHEGILTSGPRRGRQITFALLEERAPGAKPWDRDRALAELARRYLTTRGPAQLRDLAWWSGLTVAECRRGAELVGSALRRETIDGREHWSAADPPAPAAAGRVHLLPNFDEFSVAYRDRAALLDPAVPFDPAVFPAYREWTPAAGLLLSNIVTVDGRLRAAWSRTPSRAGLKLEVRPLRPFRRAEKAALTAQVERYARFLGRPVELAGV